MPESEKINPFQGGVNITGIYTQTMEYILWEVCLFALPHLLPYRSLRLPKLTQVKAPATCLLPPATDLKAAPAQLKAPLARLLPGLTQQKGGSAYLRGGSAEV